MFNIHTYRKRQQSQNSNDPKKKSNDFNKNAPSNLISENFPYERNALVHAIQNKTVDPDEIYDVLQQRTQVHRKLELNYSQTRNRPRSAVSRSTSVSQSTVPKSIIKSSRPNSAIDTHTDKYEINSTNEWKEKENTSEVGSKSYSRPQSAISRTLRRPLSGLSQDEKLVRPMSAALVNQLNTSITNFDAKIKDSDPSIDDSSTKLRYQSRSGLDLRRPSSSYRLKSASNRIVHMLPPETKDLVIDGEGNEETILQAMESVAENCLYNLNKSKDDKPKWTTGFRGKYKKEPCFEPSEAEKEKQLIFEQQLREATWEQSKQEKLEKDAMEYIDNKLRYNKQRSLFKAQQQKNMIKSVILVKEPRTIRQLEDYLKEPSKFGGSRPQSAISRIKQDENLSPNVSVFLTKRPRSSRPQSARPQVFSYKNDSLEWAENNPNPKEDIKMLDRWTATHC